MSKLKSTVILGAARLINLGVVFVSLRFYLQWIGQEAVGAIIVLQGIASYCVMLGDSGLSPGVQTQLVGAEAKGDSERAMRIVGSHRVFMIGAGLLAVLVHAGLIPLIPLKGMPQDHRLVAFFLLSGVSSMGYLVGIAYTTYLASGDRFKEIALANLASGLTYSLTSLGLVYWFRHPWGFALGNVVGQAVYLFVLRHASKKAGLEISGFRFFRDEFSPCLDYMKKSAVSSVGAVLSGLDKVIANGVVGTGPVGSMGVAQRVPQTVTMAIPFMQVFQPEYARSFLQGMPEFQRTFVRNSTATLAISLAFMFLPTCFGESLLKLWLGEQFLPILTPLLILFGLEAATQANNVAFGLAATAANKPGWIVPFVWFHGLGIVCVTVPVLHQWGLIGLATLRVLLLAVQVPVLDWVVSKHIAGGMSLSPLVPRKLAIVGISGAIWAVGYGIAALDPVASHPLLGLLLTPIWIYAFLGIVGRLRLVEFPQRLLKFFPMVAR